MRAAKIFSVFPLLLTLPIASLLSGCATDRAGNGLV